MMEERSYNDGGGGTMMEERTSFPTMMEERRYNDGGKEVQ